MYMECKKVPVMAGEPHLGTMNECELIEDDGEALGLLIEYMVEGQSCNETFTVIDDYTDEVLTLNTSDYLDNRDIDMLNEMFIASDDWDEDMITFLIQYRGFSK